MVRGKAKLNFDAIKKLLELQDRFEEADTDGSGSLEYDELAALVQRTRVGAGSAPPGDDACKASVKLLMVAYCTQPGIISLDFAQFARMLFENKRFGVECESEGNTRTDYRTPI